MLNKTINEHTIYKCPLCEQTVTTNNHLETCWKLNGMRTMQHDDIVNELKKLIPKKYKTESCLPVRKYNPTTKEKQNYRLDIVLNSNGLTMDFTMSIHPKEKWKEKDRKYVDGNGIPLING